MSEQSAIERLRASSAASALTVLAGSLPKMRVRKSKYERHQGARECARRLVKLAKQESK